MRILLVLETVLNFLIFVSALALIHTLSPIDADGEVVIQIAKDVWFIIVHILCDIKASLKLFKTQIVLILPLENAFFHALVVVHTWLF